MKFTILGFSQAKSVELGLNVNDLLILRWFVDYLGTGKMKTKKFDGVTYYWVDYSGVIEELPILYKTKPDTIYRTLKAMTKVGVLEHKTLKQGGTWSYYKLGKNYFPLISDSDTSDGNKSEGVGNKSDGNGKKSDGNGKKSRTKNPSTINPSTINPLNNIYSLVIDKLNQATGKNFKPSTGKTKQLIDARIREDFNLEDFYKVIDNKTKTWLNTEWDKYLRPETLFGTKFENYLNEKVNIKNSNIKGFIPGNIENTEEEKQKIMDFNKRLSEKQKEELRKKGIDPSQIDYENIDF